LALLSLGRVAGEFIGYVLLFREAPEAQRPSVPALRNHLLGLLDAFSKSPETQQAPPEEVEEARFALVAWADETILVSDWSGREEWLREPLQLQLFRTNRAGDEFYDHLAALRPDQNYAREVYFLCLCLGFQGGYAGRDADRAELTRQHFELLRATHRARDLATTRPVAPPAYRVEIELRGAGGKRLWPVVLGWTAGVAAVFVVLWSTLWFYATRVMLPPGS
jgi:type IV/VI secretion system ImpK/VasF family protein